MKLYGFFKFLFGEDDDTSLSAVSISKIQIINLMALLLIALGVAVIIECIFMQLHVISLTVGFAVITAVLTLYLNYKTRRVFLCGNLLTLNYVMVIIFFNLYIGGIATSALLWFFLIPVLAGVMISKRYVLYYTLFTVVVLAMFSVLSFYGIEPLRSLTHIQKQFIAISIPLLLTIIFASIIYYFIRIKDLFEEDIIRKNINADKKIQRRKKNSSDADSDPMRSKQCDYLVKQLLAR